MAGIRITSIQPDLIREIPFLNAGRGPGGFYRDTLPVHHGFVDELPEGMSAIIATADLQGRETFESSGGKPIRLLGEVLPTPLAERYLAIPLCVLAAVLFLVAAFFLVAVL